LISANEENIRAACDRATVLTILAVALMRLTIALWTRNNLATSAGSEARTDRLDTFQDEQKVLQRPGQAIQTPA
jgi:hypothetical protein